MRLFTALCQYRWRTIFALLAIFIALPISAEEDAPEPGWLFGKAVHIPSEYTNQESGYFSIVEGLNNRVYVGCAKYDQLRYDTQRDTLEHPADLW